MKKTQPDEAQLFEKINEVFHTVFADDGINVNRETTAEDIDEWDSLMHITLIGEMESTFGIKFSMKEIVGMKNVGEMADIILSRLS